MRWCRRCGSEIREGAKFCTKCGCSIIDQSSENNNANASQQKRIKNSFESEQMKREKSSFQNYDTDKTFTEKCIAFFKRVTECVMKVGVDIVKEGMKVKGSITEQINTEPNKRVDSKCPYCGSEDTFPIVKNEVTAKSKGYSYGQGCCGICLLGPFGLLCGLCGSGSEIKSKSITWWACKNCGKQHLTQYDAKEMLDMCLDKMIMNCLCYGSIGSLFLHSLLNRFLQGPSPLYGIITVIIGIIVGIIIPLVLASNLFNEVDEQIGYKVWEILDVEKKKTYWSSIKLSMVSLCVTLIMVYPMLSSFAG